ncbi:dihydroxyacetone kinase [Spiroplasma mirum ATCC 29335]|uniref:Dihydroxyacetone kinase n=1 Tax=Spiroplasma mirum ATCC 29335 TaxID=838561 RepID=W0GS00_9MOLU|nr:DAK2 domain-containing protein [Spiroplasma mirum]AHF61331.1 putative dihydroxyacetone kinase protein [Spiroplasma mirum ATCC 29335]AHI58445.1 dihydroxyacetone kinase [Spiroplasma mirum ATCC 29335]
MEFNANSFKEALISGYNNLYNFYPEIDKLNVFPVPDGDTGTNMNLTMTNAVKEINEVDSTSISKIADVFARGLIMGARGNSGVILSQIFRGFANGLKGVTLLTSDAIKAAMMQAKEVAYKAVMKPVEGTILTVIRETAENINSVSGDMNVPNIFGKIVEFSTASLNNTPELLPVLKEVGVVDSGGFGLVKIFEGMTEYFSTGKVVPQLKKKHDNSENNIIMDNLEEKFGYCTETIVMLNDSYINKIDVTKIRQTLAEQGGKSIVAVVDQEILKTHVHTLMPGTVITFLQQFGEFRNIKVDNMTLQAKKHVKTIKVERKLKNKEAIIVVSPANGISKFFKTELNVQAVVYGGQSMNPSTDDYLKAIEDVDAVDVFILPNNSNAILAGQQAAKIEKKSNVYVVPTTSVQEGMVAALSFEHGEHAKKNFSTLKNAIKNVTSLSISRSAKNTSIDGVKINKNDYMGIVNKKIMFSKPNISEVIKNLFDKTITKSTEIVTIFIGENAEAKDINMIKKYLDENFDVEYEIVNGEQQLYPYLIAVE